MPRRKKADSDSGEAPVPEKKAKTSKAQSGKTKQKKDKSTPIKKPVPSTSGKNKLKCDLNLKTFLRDASWLEKLEGEFEKEYFKKIENVLSGLQKQNIAVHPPKHLIFNAFNLTPFKDVKVVILGQDPYHDKGQAEGLSFSVPKGQAVPPSLKNIYKELAKDISGFTIPVHGCLESWAKQGVLLLNAALTVIEHTPNSHGGKKFGWQTFTDQVIRLISEGLSGVVFILWGNFAHQKGNLVDEKKHHVIKTAHPSPLSFNKFNGCACFSDTNKALKKFGKKEIDWSF